MKYETLTDVVKQSFAKQDVELDKEVLFLIKSDKRILSLIRGFIWRKYSIRIRFPLDAIILFTIQDAIKLHNKLE